jgi:hypothetical protein
MDHLAQATTDHNMQYAIKPARRAGSTHGNYTATAKPKPPLNGHLTLANPVIWTSQDTSIASVVSSSTNNAVVTGVGSVDQSTVIFAKADGISRQVPVRIVPATTAATNGSAVRGLHLSNESITVASAAGTVAISAVAVDAKGNPLSNPVTWEPQDPSVATVSPASGSVTTVTGQAGAAGRTTLIFAKTDGITRWVTVTTS